MTFVWNGRTIELAVERLGDGELRVVLPDGSERRIRARIEGGVVALERGEATVRVPVARDGRGGWLLAGGGASFAFSPAEARRARGGASGDGVLRAPMAGVVAQVLVRVGERVTAGQPVATLEAMKVLATVEAPFDGVVATVEAVAGSRVEHGSPLAQVRRDDG